MKTNEKEFNGLLCRPIEQFGVSFKDIKIPKWWDIPTAQEGIDLVNNEDFVTWAKFEDEKHDFYVHQPFLKNKGKYAAWLGCGNDDFDLGGNDDLGSSDAVRGVLLVKRKK